MSTDEQVFSNTVCNVDSIMLFYFKNNQGNPLTQNHPEKQTNHLNLLKILSLYNLNSLLYSLILM